MGQIKRPTFTNSIVFYLIICVIGYFVLYYLHSLVILNADDFYYSTFWNHGLRGFIENSINHYKTFNGRVFVHLVAQTVLAFDIKVFAVLNTLLLFFIAVFSYKMLDSESGSSKVQLMIHSAFFAYFIMLINVNALKESLLWISGSYNYMLPVLITVFAVYLNERFLLAPQLKVVSIIPFILLQIIGGATTEQCGPMTFVATFLMGGYLCIRKETSLYRAAVAPLLNLFGIITIFLSPATQNRVVSGTHVTSLTSGEGFDFNNLLSGFSTLCNQYAGKSAALIILLMFSLIASLLFLTDHSRPKPLLFGIPTSMCLLLPIFTDYNNKACILAFAVFLLFILILVITFFFRSDQYKTAVILASGAAAALLIVFTNVIEPRTTLPFLLILCFVAAYFATQMISQMKTGISAAILIATCVICVAVLMPTICGYYANHEIDKHNVQMTKEAQDSGILYYNVDYNDKYCHTPMYYDGYFYAMFVNKYDLKNCSIYMISDKMKPVYVNGDRLKSVAYIYQGDTFFPLREIITELGGSVSFDAGTIYLSYNGIDYTITNNAISYIDKTGQEQSVDIKNKCAKNYYATSFAKDVFRDAFGIMISYDKDKDCYTVNPLS